ncbi:hypothetical protein GCM10028791_20400 [Echinicola sediminis]
MKLKFYLLALGLICLSITSFGGQQSDFEKIIDQVYDDFQSDISDAALDDKVGSLLSSLDTAGYWPDIDYTSTSQTGWKPANHFSNLSQMAKAYSRSSSGYYGDSLLRERIIKASEYWLNLDPQPSSTNWFYRTITIPNAVGRMLVCLRKSPAGISAALENELINLMTKGVSLYNSPSKNGSNRTDVGQHYIIRGCLTENQSLLQNAVDFIGESIVVANGEGIQADGSFAAHGQQLYIYGYGLEFIKGIRNIAIYVTGTSYELAPEKVAIFSNFVRNGFIKTARGRYVDFNVFGRGVTRPNTGRAIFSYINKVKLFDLPAYTSFYDTVISRMNGSEPPSFGVQPEHFNYWNTDYAVHHRPGYMFGLRTVSTRTMKSEMGNGENLKGTYLTEGVTYIAVNGDEYYNIFPAWEWNKLPGTTVPEITNYPTRSSWGTNPGKSTFVGGVSDGVYGANVFAMNDYNTQAKKGWFFFDNEVVCLGAGITSSASEKINTTMNQSLLDGEVMVSENGTTQSLSEGFHDYSNGLDWVWHDSVAYVFPQGGNIRLSNDVQTGNSYDINHSYYSSADPISKEVFKLWIDHGVSPANDSYEYIVVPGISNAAEMSNYNPNNIAVLANTDSVQVVKHATLDIWQMIYYKAGTFEAEGVKVKVDKPVVLQLKGVSSGQVEIFAAEPTQSSGATVRIGLEVNGFDGMKMLDLEFPSGLMAGSTVSGTVDNNSPEYVEVEFPTGSVAIADAYVRGGAYEGDNFPTGTLVVKKGNGSYDRESYVKFDITDLPERTDSVWVRLYVKHANTTVTDTSWEFYKVDDNSWTETGITYLNKPAAGDKLGEMQGVAAGNYIQLDISDAVLAAKSEGNGAFSLKIISTVHGGNTDAQFASREETDIYKKPQLIVHEAIEIPQTAAFEAIADAYVRGGTYDGDNFSTGNLVVKKGNGSYDRESYLKFDITDLPERTDSVWVRLYVKHANTTVTDTSWEFYKVNDNSWTETGITYLNKPAAGDKLGEMQGVAAGNYIQLDISDAVLEAKSEGDAVFSLKIISTVHGGNTDAQFASREEGEITIRPQLIAQQAPEADVPLGAEAVADAYVRGGQYEHDNYPTEDLFVKKGNGSYDREAYVKFDLRELPADLDSVQLRMYVLGANTDIGNTSWEIFAVNDSTWSETVITYASRPTGGSKIGEVPGVGAGSYIYQTISDSVLNEIATGNWLSLRLSSTVLGGETDARFAPREDENEEFRPQLIPYVSALEEEENPLEYEPTDDAFVRGGTYSTNNYSSSSLQVKKDGPSYLREAFLKFDIGQLPESMDSVVLKLYVKHANTTVTDTNWEFYQVGDSTWSESTITYASKPAVGDKIGEIPGAVAGSVVYLPITNEVLDAREVGNWFSIRINSTVTGSTTDAQFASKEDSDSDYRPKLLVFEEENSESMTEDTGKTPKGLEGKDLPNPKVLLYPNPLAGMATIKTDQSFHTLIIQNHRGEVVLETTGLDTNEYQLDLSGYRNGMYYLKVIGDGFVEIKKAIKRR